MHFQIRPPPPFFLSFSLRQNASLSCSASRTACGREALKQSMLFVLVTVIIIIIIIMTVFFSFSLNLFPIHLNPRTYGNGL